MNDKWTFWIDCGGTFTDIIALNQKGEHKVHKILSHSPHYQSAVVQGITEILGHHDFRKSVQEIRLGTTVATNAFLEKKGHPCALITTLGHRDVLEIRRQSRPRLFDIDIEKTPPLYSFVTSIKGRMDSHGNELIALDEEIATFELQRILDSGIKSVAISLLHSTKNPSHELQLKKIALKLGFEYISLSHEVSPIAKYVDRTETAVVDSYLSPFLNQYTKELEKLLGIDAIFYMQSDGGLCKGVDLKGYNALLSGPAGGLIGAIDIAKEYGIKKIITFDMGGTSTDVAVYNEELQINPNPNFYGINLLAPMVDIHTVAAGGGSILSYDDGRFKVGPESAGSFPGPACYRNGGPLTVTDANLFLKRIDPMKFPKVFGPNKDQFLDEEVVKEKFLKLEKELNIPAHDIALGFLDVAVATMSRAVRKISIEKGYDPADFTFISFGGAGGQLAIKVAENLNIQQVLIHPLSSVLSAFGMGKANHALSVKSTQTDNFTALEEQIKEKFYFSDYETQKNFLLRAKGSDHEVEISAANIEIAKNKFTQYYQHTFGLELDREIECVAISLKALKDEAIKLQLEGEEEKVSEKTILSQNNTAIIVEEGWQGTKNSKQTWFFTPTHKQNSTQKRDQRIELEIFYQRLQFIAEQMGYRLQKLAQSINIKERNDFSCALFTPDFELIANAPHIPVHLGSMNEAVRAVGQLADIKAGDSFICNSPQFGGTHLPDVTIVTPIFINQQIVLWTASRGHHADIGGKSPGSMPGDSVSLSEEGVIIKPTKIVSEHIFDEKRLFEILVKVPYPVRNFDVNLNDIKAKIAANLKGVLEIEKLVSEQSVEYIERMCESLLDYSHRKVALLTKKIEKSTSAKHITPERKLVLSLSKNKNKLIFDFEGTTGLLKTNFNTPIPIVKATIMFALRSMLKNNIPMNSGLMRGIEILIPQDCMLNPKENSPVVAGNVETSQALCDLVFQAFHIKANSYGTMNNLSFGNESYQYYETVGGGSGASQTAQGASAVQVNMTNSLLTDVEVFEERFPVRVELMGLRYGSGGLGKNRGGDGIYRQLFFTENMSLNMISQSRIIPPAGLKNGLEGMRGLNQVEKDGHWQELAECFSLELTAGQRFSLTTPGGGGYGDPPTEKNNLVFGFGSNMDLAQIKKRCPSAKIIARGKVQDHEVRYTRYSPIRKGGVADMSYAPGKYVLGLIVSINEQDLKVLDKIECSDNGYQRIEIDIEDDNGKTYHCYAYDVIDKEPDIAPTKVYEWLVYSGAYYLNAPSKYLEHILSYRKD
ncbi:MAG: 5-oxoprolinase [Halobacteriovoraceae bacterium]|nr:5-oxoprolinase [Halobacteriovoraceae bacterium]